MNLKGAVYLEWLDSAATKGWHSCDTSGLLPIKSIGWLVDDAKEHITISTSASSERYVDQLTIPKCAILKRKML